MSRPGGVFRTEKFPFCLRRTNSRTEGRVPDRFLNVDRKNEVLEIARRKIGTDANENVLKKKKNENRFNYCNVFDVRARHSCRLIVRFIRIRHRPLYVINNSLSFDRSVRHTHVDSVFVFSRVRRIDHRVISSLRCFFFSHFDNRFIIINQSKTCDGESVSQFITFNAINVIK